MTKGLISIRVNHLPRIGLKPGSVICAAATVGDRDGVRVRFRRTQQDHDHDRQHPHTHALKQWLVVFNGVLINMVLFVITKYLVNNFITYFWRQQKQTPLAQLELQLELF